MSTREPKPNRMYRYQFDSDILGDLNLALSHTPAHLRASASSSPSSSASVRRTRTLASSSGRRTYALLDPITESEAAAAEPRSMARPGSSQRPTHIALPTVQYPRTSDASASAAPAPLASPTSPRSSFLPSFMRNRSRAATITGRASPRAEQADPLNAAAAAPAAAPAAPSVNGASTVTRDAGVVTRSVSTPSGGALAGDSVTAVTASAAAPAIDPKGKTHRIRLVPHLENSRSLAFDPVVREAYPISVGPGQTPSGAAVLVPPIGPLVAGKPPVLVLKIGRFTDKTPAGDPDRPATGIGGPTIAIAGGGGEVTSGKIAFKSKVVSRTHAEIWCEAGGKFYIRDTASSSGTFLNHIRLSSPNTDSRPTPLNDGDVLQLGVDYQGGHEDQFRCVKMRVELGREWQRAANEFNTNALRQLKALGGAAPSTPDNKTKGDGASSISKKSRASVTDCCICLFSVTVCQSLFIAPCSHVFHYKCIRPLLQQHHPGFSCPLCRTFANLEEDVEVDDPPEIASRRTSSVSRRPSAAPSRGGLDPLSPTVAHAPAPPTGADQFNLEAQLIDEPVGESGSASEEGGRTEDDTRQETLGADPLGDIEMGPPSREVSAPASDRSDAGSAAAAYSSGAERRRQAIAESSRRNSGSGADPMATVAIPDIQTPRNEYFLSTLAPGSIPVANPAAMPGLLQQLDQAEGSGTGAVSSGLAGQQGHGQEATLAGAEDAAGEARRREESEMMFS